MPTERIIQLVKGLPFQPVKEDYFPLHDCILEEGAEEEKENMKRILQIYDRTIKWVCIHCEGKIHWRRGVHFDNEVICRQCWNSWDPSELQSNLRTELFRYYGFYFDGSPING